MAFKYLRDSFPHAAIRLGAVILLLPAGAARAQAPDEAWHRDLLQTVQARKLLLDDPQLGPLNLGVRVADRSAVLWGPVPSQELSHRAERRLQTMFELIEIRNRLSVDADDEDGQFTPETPRLLPGQPPPEHSAPRRRLLEPATGVALAGIVTPDETLTAHSSPLTQGTSPQAWGGLATLHMPFLGSIAVPR
ncbi:MAG TPA: BON domain-containing protein [Gemmataceae bacterium]|jgi:hypothetical protein|nr:BON domain-containing protein [Gemmataceae bacterium]